LIGKYIEPWLNYFWGMARGGVGSVLIWLQDRSGILKYDWIKEMKYTSVGCKGIIEIVVIMAVISSR